MAGPERPERRMTPRICAILVVLNLLMGLWVYVSSMGYYSMIRREILTSMDEMVDAGHLVIVDSQQDGPSRVAPGLLSHIQNMAVVPSVALICNAYFFGCCAWLHRNRRPLG